jgi:hypothetical protein
MIAILTSPPCADVARAADVAIVAEIATNASGRRSFHLLTFMFPPLVPARLDLPLNVR